MHQKQNNKEEKKKNTKWPYDKVKVRNSQKISSIL